MSETQNWRRCSFCKKEILFAAKYYVCSVSSCRQKRTGLVFCSSSCWDGHDGEARHRESWAEEATAPTRNVCLAEQPARDSSPKGQPREILVVVSKLKAYIKARAEMNTSDTCCESLSDELRRQSEQAIAEARKHNRKTVLERDFVSPPPPIDDPTLPRDTLVVISKLKQYIRESSEMSTADATKDILSDFLRARCEIAIRNARQDGRKTVLDRDFR